MKRTSQERFFEKVIRLPDDGCWLWTGGKTAKGYGQFRPNRPASMVLAHRFSWSVANGEIPEGLQCLHHCDTPGCVRPDHLFLGTHQDNMDDKVLKGRVSRGGPGPYVTRKLELRFPEILERRKKGETLRSIAAAFECDPMTVRRFLVKQGQYARLKPGPPPRAHNVRTAELRKHTSEILARFNDGVPIARIARDMRSNGPTIASIVRNTQKSAILSSHNQNL